MFSFYTYYSLYTLHETYDITRSNRTLFPVVIIISYIIALCVVYLCVYTRRVTSDLTKNRRKCVAVCYLNGKITAKRAIKETSEIVHGRDGR